MLDQTHIVNDIKEKCCYVTTSFKDDLKRSRSVQPMANAGFFFSFFLAFSIPGNNGALHYVLPDFSRNRHGYVREQNIYKISSQFGQSRTETTEPQLEESEQILYMTNERFSVPELIFNPTDIGIFFKFLY